MRLDRQEIVELLGDLADDVASVERKYSDDHTTRYTFTLHGGGVPADLEHTFEQEGVVIDIALAGGRTVWRETRPEQARVLPGAARAAVQIALAARAIGVRQLEALVPQGTMLEELCRLAWIDAALPEPPPLLVSPWTWARWGGIGVGETVTLPNGHARCDVLEGRPRELLVEVSASADFAGRNVALALRKRKLPGGRGWVVKRASVAATGADGRDTEAVALSSSDRRRQLAQSTFVALTVVTMVGLWGWSHAAVEPGASRTLEAATQAAIWPLLTAAAATWAQSARDGLVKPRLAVLLAFLLGATVSPAATNAWVLAAMWAYVAVVCEAPALVKRRVRRARRSTRR